MIAAMIVVPLIGVQEISLGDRLIIGSCNDATHLTMVLLLSGTVVQKLYESIQLAISPLILEAILMYEKTDTFYLKP